MISSFHISTKKEVRKKYSKLQKFRSQYLSEECDGYLVARPFEITS